MGWEQRPGVGSPAGAVACGIRQPALPDYQCQVFLQVGDERGAYWKAGPGPWPMPGAWTDWSGTTEMRGGVAVLISLKDLGPRRA